MSDIVRRKAEHIRLALEPGSQTGEELWKDYQLPYKALPETDLKNVDTGTQLWGKKLNQPLIIASMTGGTEHAGEINKNLAAGAEKLRVALGVGSQRAALEKPELAETFALVRKWAPTTVIIANMGAVQLNYGRAEKDFAEAVRMAGADGLYLHLNPLQEAIQPEGDTDFSGLLGKIEKLVKQVKVPVWIKEVGNGLDPESARKLIEAGVDGIDCAGVGGTSWTWIEGQRAENENLAGWFKTAGWRTEELVPVLAKIKSGAKLIASGGIRSPIQGLKAHLLGADYYSAARPFLEAAMTSSEDVMKLLSDWEKGLKIAMFGIGAENWEEAGKLKPEKYGE